MGRSILIAVLFRVRVPHSSNRDETLHSSGGGVLELFNILAGFPSCDMGYIGRVLLLSFLISFAESLPKHHLPSSRTNVFLFGNSF